MSFFKIIIPNYNAKDWNKRCVESVLNQTFKDFEIVIVDDMSTEKESIKHIKDFESKDNRIVFIENRQKRWNGGSRNVAIEYDDKSQYTLFLDCDDWLNSDTVLESIYDTIVKNSYPDCVRLPYICESKNDRTAILLDQNNPKDLVNSLYIAPFTKCVKSKLVTLFPENTLIEDVVQHISQCDNIETVAVCPVPIVVWNRNNLNAISLKENQTKYNSKRISSIYRNIADLMDLQCKHGYCEEHRLWRLACYKNMVRDGKEETF